MTKIYRYEFKEINSLFNAKLMEIDPENNPVTKGKMLTDAQRTQMFQDILNDYGEKGWRIVSTSPLIGGAQYYLFEKEMYKQK